MNTSVLDKLSSKVKRTGGVILCTIMTVSIIGCGNKTTQENDSRVSNPPVASSPAQATPDASAPVDSEQPTELQVDIAQLATAIFEAGDYTDELDVLEDEMFDAVFPSVDLELVTSKMAYVGSGASAEQIVVIEARDEDAAGKVKEALSQKVNDDIEQNADYLPQEVDKLKNPVLVVSGKYVVLCVSNDNSKIEEVLQQKGIMS